MPTTRSAFFCTGVMLLVMFTTSKAGQKQNAASEPEPQTAATLHHSSATSPSNRPYSDAVRLGDTLYLAGKLGTDSSGKLAPGGIAPETRQTMENIRGLLEANGSSLDHVVKCTVMLADIREWGEMNSVYVTFFKKDRLPARSAFGTSGLSLGARVEIECIAAVK